MLACNTLTMRMYPFVQEILLDMWDILGINRYLLVGWMDASNLTIWMIDVLDTIDVVICRPFPFLIYNNLVQRDIYQSSAAQISS